MLIVNPVAGRGIATRAQRAVAERLRGADPDLQVRAGADAEQSAELIRDAVAAGTEVVATLGGDGLVQLALQAVVGSDTALAVLPAGTGNDTAAALGLPPDPVDAAEHVAAALRRGDRRRIDLGRTGAGTWFSTVACTGFDSAVTERANTMRWPRGPRRYEVAILAELANLRPRPVVIETDDGTRELSATLVAVGNTPSYGGGLRICPTAELTDGLFDVTVVAAVSRRRLLRVLPALRTGKHVAEPEVSTFRARSVRIGGDPGWLAYADGERLGPLPLVAQCVPGALTVVA